LFEQKAGEHDEHEGAADILQAENGQDCRRDDGSTFADRLVLVTTLAMKASQPKAPEDWRSSASPSCRHRSAAFTQRLRRFTIAPFTALPEFQQRRFIHAEAA